MISVTKLLGGDSYFGDRLRYDTHSSAQLTGARPGMGPVVVWNATKTCNLECKHCYADAETRRFVGELTTEEAQGMIEDLAAMNIPALLISGGEPLVRPDILDLADYASSLGIRVTFSTNGTLIDKEKAERLKKIGVTYVGISIDGGEKRHDLFRGKQGAFKGAIRGIRHCRDAGIRVGIRFTVTQENLGELPQIFHTVEQEGIGRLCIYHLVYSGRGSYLSGIDLTVEEKRKLMVGLMEQVETWNEQDRKIEVMTVDNHADAPFIYLRLLERNPDKAEAALQLIKNNGGNRSGIAIGCIDSFGMVHPDQFTSHHTLGSIRERRFSEIWRDSAIPLLDGLRRRKELLKGRCATCKWLPYCNGNFRARAEAATGDYWQSDPGCYLLDSEIAVGTEVFA
jgi:Fe-coproporphyrin III synthase